jgi:hypothetical protein
VPAFWQQLSCGQACSACDSSTSSCSRRQAKFQLYKSILNSCVLQLLHRHQELCSTPEYDCWHVVVWGSCGSQGGSGLSRWAFVVGTSRLPAAGLAVGCKCVLCAAPAVTLHFGAVRETQGCPTLVFSQSTHSHCLQTPPMTGTIGTCVPFRFAGLIAPAC